jgi:hypothetical protein
MGYREEKLVNLAERLFDEDCKKENLLWKIEAFDDKILELKYRILDCAGYPDKLEVYEVGPYVIVINGREIEVFTADQYEKIASDYEQE